MTAPIVFAHRGASKLAPENTMAAFRKALELGADGIELDVHLSRDGHIVVTHDELVNRTSNGKGFVKDKTLDELKSLDFGSWFSPTFKDERIPELEDILKLTEGWDGILNIELKNGPVLYPGIEQAVLDMLGKYNMIHKTIISSFNHYSLVEMRRLNSDIRIAPLYEAGLFEPWNYAKKIGAYAIHPLFYNIVPQIMEGCRLNGIKVHPYTVDDPEYIRAMVAAGVDGIITNVPDVALKIIGEMRG
jgi:glycerophosphoryl diester phosphodiesterase